MLAWNSTAPNMFKRKTFLLTDLVMTQLKKLISSQTWACEKNIHWSDMMVFPSQFFSKEKHGSHVVARVFPCLTSFLFRQAHSWVAPNLTLMPTLHDLSSHILVKSSFSLVASYSPRQLFSSAASHWPKSNFLQQPATDQTSFFLSSQLLTKSMAPQ